MLARILDTTLAEARRAVRRAPWVMRLGLPVGASIALHGLIAAVLVAGAWRFHDALAGGQARTEVVITIPRSGPPPAPPPSRAPAEPLPAAAGLAAPPRLEGLSSLSGAPAPVLRSAGAAVPGTGEFLRREDEGAVGGATFAGMGARRAQSVVYVVDASGAMVSSLKFVLAELERSVRSLSSSQKFQVVLFHDQGGGGYELFPAPRGSGGLVAATPTNTEALSRWLNAATPGGRSNPMVGLRAGLAFRPDAVFFLSRSIRRSGGELDAEATGFWGRGRDQIMAELETLNPRRGAGRRVVIKCIQFIEEDPTGTMQAIGTAHGDGPGSYSVRTLKDLGG
jgi:hypothetical protein